jgi:hypothetical protein
VNQAARAAGMSVSTPGLDKRFNAQAANFLAALLTEAVRQTITRQPATRSLLSRFQGVYIGDSTVVTLPAGLADQFRGNRAGTKAVAKVAVQWDVTAGGLGLWLSDGVVHDGQTGIVAQTLPVGALHLRDLGFFNLTRFAEDDAHGVYYFSRYKIGTLVYTPQGQAFELSDWLEGCTGVMECDIRLGAAHLPCRLIAVPVPPEQVGRRRKRLREIARKRQQPTSPRSLALVGWTLYVTNIPPALLSADEAVILGTTRWQVEGLFDVWKNDGRLDESRSRDPQRVRCEFYAKLLALLLQHWMLVAGGWQRWDRSYHRAVQVMHKYAFHLVIALPGLKRLTAALTHLARTLSHTCGMSKRRTHPLTFQAWLKLDIP